MKFSHYQEAIFDFVASGSGNGQVNAVAGSGKSTTTEHCDGRAGGSSLHLAFNRAIADAQKAKGLNSRTFHSLTYMPVTTSRNVKSPEQNKLNQLVRKNLGSNEAFLYRSFITKLVGIGKQYGIGAGLRQNNEANWMDLVDHYGLELENEDADLVRALELTSDLLNWSNASKMVDFDDLLYFAVKDDLVLPKYDFVFVDEAQDTNAIQRAILRKVMKPTSRLIAVGDPYQAIYGFRGADSDSMDLIEHDFQCQQFPLSISYRCPQSVVRYAQRWVPHLEAFEGAAEGVVDEIREWGLDIFRAEDLVLCRKNAPLLWLGYKFLRARIPVQILGREIGEGLKNLIKKMKADTISNLEYALRAHTRVEVTKAMENDNEGKADAAQDKCDAILALAESCASIDELLFVIKELFANKKDAVTLATIHKSKGLEAERVFWLDRSECPAPWAKKKWEHQQELNLCYVASTRAKKELYFIERSEATC